MGGVKGVVEGGMIKVLSEHPGVDILETGRGEKEQACVRVEITSRLGTCRSTVLRDRLGRRMV